MSGSALVLIELLLVFGLALGWGLNELRVLRRYRDDEKPRDGTGRDGKD